LSNLTGITLTDQDVNIRDFREEDYPEISELWQATGLGNPARGDTIDIINQTIRLGGRLLVMEIISTGTICGTSWLTTDGRRILLHHFGILAEYQGNGFSKVLLKASLQFVKSKGLQVKLEAHSSNEKAIKLYKKFGFRLLDGYDIYIMRDLSNL
jgi:ribosomal protein S18 acetylase RimI-like enzyme